MKNLQRGTRPSRRGKENDKVYLAVKQLKGVRVRRNSFCLFRPFVGAAGAHCDLGIGGQGEGEGKGRVIKQSSRSRSLSGKDLLGQSYRPYCPGHSQLMRNKSFLSEILYVWNRVNLLIIHRSADNLMLLRYHENITVCSYQ
jgi:hypothetical protein